MIKSFLPASKLATLLIKTFYTFYFYTIWCQCYYVHTNKTGKVQHQLLNNNKSVYRAKDPGNTVYAFKIALYRMFHVLHAGYKSIVYVYSVTYHTQLCFWWSNGIFFKKVFAGAYRMEKGLLFKNSFQYKECSKKR